MRNWLNVLIVFVLVFVASIYGAYEITKYNTGLGVFLLIIAVVLSFVVVFMSYVRGVGLPLDASYMKIGKVYVNHGIVKKNNYERFAVITGPDGNTRMYRVGTYVVPTGRFKPLFKPPYTLCFEVYPKHRLKTCVDKTI